MKRVRFSQRAYIDDRLYEPGEEAVILDRHVADHIEDLTQPKAIPLPSPIVQQQPVKPA